jgi:polyphosphate kinase
VHGPVNLARLHATDRPGGRAAAAFPPYTASYPRQLSPGQSFFDRLQRGDVLIHQPFESFDGVLAFLREAVHDPQVLAIKQTIYRTGADSVLMDLLREGVRRGKEVTGVVELKARFDEEANINWAEMLESIGAQVVYGVVGLKTHAKMLLVTRREGKRAAALRPPVDRQLQPAHRCALHRHQPPHGRPAADRRHGGGVRAPGQPEPAAEAQPRV